jgi:hypothetical protein
LWLAYGYVIPSVVILGMLIISGISITAGYLSKHYLMGIMCWWGVYVATVMMLVLNALAQFPPVPVHPIAWLFGMAFLLTPLAAAAAAPLVLASFRHG